MENLGPWIQTATGKPFRLLQPQPEDVCIEDIAHALSHICRFTGHCKFFYSVAQHSFHVSQIVPPAIAMEGLLHDAAEAYTGDVSRPLKQILNNYALIEANIMLAIRHAFGIYTRPEHHALIKEADNIMLETERRDLMVAHPDAEWKASDKVMDTTIVPWSPLKAKNMFLLRFNELAGKE